MTFCYMYIHDIVNYAEWHMPSSCNANLLNEQSNTPFLYKCMLPFSFYMQTFSSPWHLSYMYGKAQIQRILIEKRYNISIELNSLYLFLDPFYFTMDITACTCSIQAHHCYSMKFNTNTIQICSKQEKFFFDNRGSAFGIQMYKLCF